MSALNELFANLLAFFFEHGGNNYVAAIALLTLVVMVLLLPLTVKGTRSMLAMQKLAPDIKRLQDEHKNDRQKLNEEMMALYRDNKINPMGGCLPLLLQMPVFFVLYQVIMGLVHKKDGKPDPRYIEKSSDLYRAIVDGNGRLESFGIDLATSATRALHAGVSTAWPYILLLLVMVGAQYWQQWQVTSHAPPADNPQADMMRKIQKIFPPMFGIMSLGFPAGVVVYWVISSLFRVGQQSAMYRFDPILASRVESAHQEADSFLKESKKIGRAQQPGVKPAKSTKSTKKKRKGR